MLVAPALSGEAARPRAATLPIIDVLNYASGKAGGRCAPRLIDCGARAGGTGSAGCAGRRRIVAALGCSSLLWAPTKRGREHRSHTTCHDTVARFGSRRISPNKARDITPLNDRRVQHGRDTPQSGSAVAAQYRSISAINRRRTLGEIKEAANRARPLSPSLLLHSFNHEGQRVGCFHPSRINCFL